jgi:murein DD-endopeptidase MepM/ murein hydrolase activator NlpD
MSGRKASLDLAIIIIAVFISIAIFVGAGFLGTTRLISSKQEVQFSRAIDTAATKITKMMEYSVDGKSYISSLGSYTASNYDDSNQEQKTFWDKIKSVLDKIMPKNYEMAFTYPGESVAKFFRAGGKTNGCSRPADSNLNGVKLAWPVPEKFKSNPSIISSLYGPRFLTDSCGCHRGVDFAVDTKTPVYAALDGKVKEIGWNVPTDHFAGFGYMIRLEHTINGKRYYTEYAHLSENGAIVKVGDQVKAGQQIAWSGNTGYSTGPHLHFQLDDADATDRRESPTNINPCPLLDPAPAACAYENAETMSCRSTYADSTYYAIDVPVPGARPDGYKGKMRIYEWT